MPDTWLTRECPKCGKQFETPRSWPRTYCSGECYKARNAERRITANCPECGEEFWYHASWPRVYCSNVCKGKATIVNIPTFAPTAYASTCEACGKPFTTTPKRTRGRFCSQRCYGRWLSESGAMAGANSPNWRGGGTYHYYGPNWTYVRRLVRERDKVCQDCGVTPEEYGETLDAHHIRPFRDFGIARYREANDLSNLVLLCTDCHLAREWPNSARATRQKQR